MQKKIILILAFILPVLGVFIFNFFSKSYFDLPVYYQSSLPEEINCPSIKIPYQVATNLSFSTLDHGITYPFSMNTITIFSFDQGNDFFRAELNKVGDVFANNPMVQLYAVGMNKNESSIPISTNIIGLELVDSTYEEWKSCIFLFTSKEDNAVLIDHENKIRGYYNLLDGDLTDSLIVETKILLHQINNADNGK